MKQLKLFKEQIRNEHGGSLSKNRRKEERPLAFTRPIHLILKASSPDILLENKQLVMQTLKEMSSRFSVKIFDVGVNYDHIHLHLKFENRITYNSWVRSTTGVLSRRIFGLKWLFTPYTRIESWGRDFKNVNRYIRGNSDRGEFILSALQYVESVRRSAIKDLGPDARVIA